MSDSLLSKNDMTTNKDFVVEYCKDTERRELYELFLEVIEEGVSYPQTLPYSFEDFLRYFFADNSRVLICKNKDKNIVGGFYIKPNFPGRCAHIANCGYIVKKKYRGQKIGFHLGKYSIDIGKELGYKSIIFNLVFKENFGAVKLWEKLGFKILGTIPNAVNKGNGEFQDAYIMFLDLSASFSL